MKRKYRKRQLRKGHIKKDWRYTSILSALDFIPTLEVKYPQRKHIIHVDSAKKEFIEFECTIL